MPEPFDVARFDEASKHPYECRCDLCIDWWEAVGGEEDDESSIDDDMNESECALRRDGQCGLAGTEHCDFVCSMRDTEFYAGSKAWIAKHTRINRRRVMRRYL